LKAQLNALNHNKLELVSRHLEELNAEFDLLNSQIAHLSSGDDQLVEDLYKSLSMCFEYRTVLPLVVHRLEAIKSVHEEGSWFNQRVHELTDKFEKVRTRLQDLDLEEVFREWTHLKKSLD
jgi:predicted nuclease with TOPRIM domain